MFSVHYSTQQIRICGFAFESPVADCAIVIVSQNELESVAFSKGCACIPNRVCLANVQAVGHTV